MQGNHYTNPEAHWEYMRYRLTRFGQTIVVMSICFILYYLGFFGTYEGPLNPSNIGQTLDAQGVDKAHVAFFFLGLFFLLLTWNWILNAFFLYKGKRLTCAVSDTDGEYCQAKVQKDRWVDQEGRERVRYVCDHGHISSTTHFQAYKKGPWSYCLCLAMALISGLCIYWI